MGTSQVDTGRREQELLGAARQGDEGAYARLVEPYRGELHAHCYRMLGSVHDAEDALQDAMLRAWRGLPRFEGRSSFRSWLYRIATNSSLDVIGRRPKRVLPVDYAPAADPHEGPGEPVLESVWIEPYADQGMEIEDGLAGPEARYEQREGVELAFVAALQHLPPNQRAVLILREVLGFSAAETADSLETTTASVNSALQRARKAVEDKLPEQSQQQTLRSLGDDRVRELVESYMEAWERCDVDKVVSMLAEDAAFTMPPLGTWFGGRDEIEVFLRLSPMSGDWEWKPLRVRANGQEALAFYAWNPGEDAYTRFALNVLTFRDELIAEVDAFIARAPETPDRETVLRMPEQPVDELAMDAAFKRLGLPERLTSDGAPA
ncbi:MAG TPA: sigma-70 family RNA polymerase sigma factor [Solirubrobacterales bacterium]|jgi:RNA polymerase sigma-70 factor (ECF subfamily)|nr:sigma-70 family RNA polymerase sigma factor [Solirubrobacterales bacterium]